MAKGVTMYNQNDQGCCWQPLGQHNYRLFSRFFFPKDTFHLPTIWRVHLYCSEMEKDVQRHLEGQQREEMAGGGSNGQDEVTNNLDRAKKEK